MAPRHHSAGMVKVRGSEFGECQCRKVAYRHRGRLKTQRSIKIAVVPGSDFGVGVVARTLLTSCFRYSDDMCVIAGIVGGDGEYSSALANMIRAQAHRGPDGSGTVTYEGGAAGAGVRAAHPLAGQVLCRSTEAMNDNVYLTFRTSDSVADARQRFPCPSWSSQFRVRNPCSGNRNFSSHVLLSFPSASFTLFLPKMCGGRDRARISERFLRRWSGCARAFSGRAL